MAPDREVRRLAAVLAADMVGYSRLMEADEGGTIARHRAHREELIDPVIAEHQGRIFKTTGDGILVEFGSAVDAVRCALDIQRGMAEREAEVPPGQRIIYRIGVNIGDVVIDGDDILGEGVNVAARIEALARPGKLCMSEDAYRQVRRKFHLTVEDGGRRRLKNIDEPVQVYHVDPLAEPPSSAKTAPLLRRPLRRRQAFVAALAGVVVAAVSGGLAWYFLAGDRTPAGGTTVEPRSSASLTRDAELRGGKPTVAVMPFQNLTGDDKQAYFSDGIASDIAGALGRYREIAVLSFNTTRLYRASAAEPQKASLALGARYIATGSLRRTNNRLRIAARLIDARNGTILWSTTFDKESQDIFAVQEAIARQIAGTLVANLKRAERRRALAKPAERLDAYDLVLRGRALLLSAARQENRLARDLFRRAAALDSNYAAAYAWQARARYLTAVYGWTGNPSRALRRAEQSAQKALELEPDNVLAYRVLARIHSIQFQNARAIAEIDRAIELNPSDAEAYGDKALILLWSSRVQKALVAAETAFAYDPNLPADYILTHGLAYYTLRRHADAIRVLERGAARYPRSPLLAAALVAAYARTGRLADARRNAEKVKRLLPIFDPVSFGARFKDRKHHDYLAEGLKKGGLK